MVIPAIGVVIGNDDGGMLPFRPLFEEINHLDDPFLLIERTGIAGMSILIAGGLDVADGGKVSSLDGVEEVVSVVLVVCPAVVIAAHNLWRGWACVPEVCRRFVILKRLVVRNVIARQHFGPWRH